MTQEALELEVDFLRRELSLVYAALAEACGEAGNGGVDWLSPQIIQLQAEKETMKAML